MPATAAASANTSPPRSPETRPIMQPNSTSTPRADYQSISPMMSAKPDPSSSTHRTTNTDTSSNSNVQHTTTLNPPSPTTITTARPGTETLQRRNPSPRSKQTTSQTSTNNATETHLAHAPPPSSRWHDLWEKYGSVELENKGSVARDHLALERTFLAWLRTSLSFASIGIAVTQLFRLNTTIAKASSSINDIDPTTKKSSQNSNSSSSSSSTATYTPPHQQAKNTSIRHVGKPLGATFIFISILILLIGFHRYFEAQHYVIRGKFPASRASVILVSMVAGALIAASFLVVIVVGDGVFER